MTNKTDSQCRHRREADRQETDTHHRNYSNNQHTGDSYSDSDRHDSQTRQKLPGGSGQLEKLQKTGTEVY
jgi:hypothetical protein